MLRLSPNFETTGMWRGDYWDVESIDYWDVESIDYWDVERRLLGCGEDATGMWRA